MTLALAVASLRHSNFETGRCFRWKELDPKYLDPTIDLLQKEGNIRIKGSDTNRSKIDPSQISND